MEFVEKLLVVDLIGFLQLPGRRVDVAVTEPHPSIDIVFLHMSRRRKRLERVPRALLPHRIDLTVDPAREILKVRLTCKPRAHPVLEKSYSRIRCRIAL